MNKPPLLLIPGLACTRTLWAHQIAHLMDRADVMVVDHSRSDTMPGIVDDILTDAPDRFALAGFSMGGYIAMELMKTAPERVDKMALIGTKHSQDDAVSVRRREVSIRLTEDGRYGDAIAQMLPVLVHPARLKDKTLTGAIRAMAADLGPEAFVRQQKANLGRGVSDDILKAMRCPTLILCGREDKLTPPSVHEEIQALIPGAKLTIIENCGHMAPIEQPTEVSIALEGWLKI